MFSLVYWGLKPQQQPGSYRGGPTNVHVWCLYHYNIFLEYYVNDISSYGLVGICSPALMGEDDLVQGGGWILVTPPPTLSSCPQPDIIIVWVSPSVPVLIYLDSPVIIFRWVRMERRAVRLLRGLLFQQLANGSSQVFTWHSAVAMCF